MSELFDVADNNLGRTIWSKDSATHDNDGRWSFIIEREDGTYHNEESGVKGKHLQMCYDHFLKQLRKLGIA